MAGRGTSASFLDRLQGLADEIAKLAGAPDAGPGGREFAMALLDQVQERMQVQTQAVNLAGNDLGAAPAGQMGEAAGMADMLGQGPMPGSSVPAMTQEAPTRLPTPSPDMSGATEALRQAMA